MEGSPEEMRLVERVSVRVNLSSLAASVDVVFSEPRGFEAFFAKSGEAFDPAAYSLSDEDMHTLFAAGEAARDFYRMLAEFEDEEA